MNPGAIAASPAWDAVGWTMIHLGWVGVLIGLVAATLRRLLRSARPEARHGAALACLLALAVAPVAIFAFVYRPAIAAPRLIDLSGEGRADMASTVAVGSHSSLANTLRGLDAGFGALPGRKGSPGLESLVAWLPGIWIIGSLGTLALLATGLIGVERLRRSSLVLDAGPIAGRCRELARALGIARRVGVAVCDRLAAPILVGVIRPMILIPPAALSGWSVEQVEMALLHELAHLRRRDNLVNLLQRIVESMVFFHPVTWWLSAWVRLEREHCCDRLVVERTGRPCEYARMLASLAGSGRPRQQPAPAMAERPLMTRIRRILDMEDRSMRMTFPEGLGLVAAVILGASMTLGASAGSPPADRDGDAGRRMLARLAAEAAAIPNPEVDRDGRGETLISIARAQLKVGDRDGAMTTMRSLDEGAGPLHFPPAADEGFAAWSRFENLLESIRIRRTAGDLDGARSLLDRATRLQEPFDEARVRAAFVRVQESLDEAARKESDELQVVGAGKGASFFMEMSYIMEAYPALINEHVAIGNEDEALRLIRRYLRAIEPVRGPMKATMLGYLGRLLVKVEADEGREVIEQARRETLALEGPEAERAALPSLVWSMAEAGDMDGALALLRGKSCRVQRSAVEGLIKELTMDDQRIPWFDPVGIKITIGDQSLTPKDPAAARTLLPKLAGFVRSWEDAKAKARTLSVIAHLQARAGDFAGAIATAGAIPDLKRSDFPGPTDGFYDAIKPATFAIVAGLQAEAGSEADATAAFGKARMLAGAVGAEDQKLVALIVIAQKQAEGGRDADAKATIAEATAVALIQPEPRRSRALVMLARVQIDVDDFAGALRAAEAAREQPGIEKAWILDALSASYEEAGDQEKLADLAARALAGAKPNDDGAIVLAGERRFAITRDTFIDFDVEYGAEMIRLDRDQLVRRCRMRAGGMAALIREVQGLPAGSRDDALAEIAGYLFHRGEVDPAVNLLTSIESPSSRLNAFTSLAWAIPKNASK